MALRIKDSEFYAIDAHSHLGRRKTPLGHGVASFLGDDLVRNLDEVDWIARWHFLSALPTPIIPKPTRSWPKKWPSTRNGSSAFAVSIPISVRKLRRKALDHCLGTLKLRGIKLHPEIEFFDPNEAELMEPIYVAARRYHVPIIFHTGMSSKASPGVIAELAAQHKDVPVILGHMGVSEYVKLAVAVARQNEQYIPGNLGGWLDAAVAGSISRRRHEQNSLRLRSSL